MDRPDIRTELEITPEMIAAGIAELRTSDSRVMSEEMIVCSIFDAMFGAISRACIARADN
jgi:hypothetical protein